MNAEHDGSTITTRTTLETYDDVLFGRWRTILGGIRHEATDLLVGQARVTRTRNGGLQCCAGDAAVGYSHSNTAQPPLFPLFPVQGFHHATLSGAPVRAMSIA